jgi:YD repeat-containing protein
LKVQESKSGFAITYAYSDAGRLINRTDWTGSGASFSYDAAGRLVSFVDAVGETSYTYDADRNLVKQVNVNGTVEEISYNAAGQVTEIVHKRSNGQVFGYLSYGYNEDGLVSDVVEGDGSVVTYNYDPLFRLISEQRWEVTHTRSVTSMMLRGTGWRRFGMGSGRTMFTMQRTGYNFM